MYKIKNKSSTNSAPVRRGKSLLIYRLTGRDGPPEFGNISRVPAWLARGTPAKYRNFGMHNCANEGRVRGPDTRGITGMLGMQYLPDNVIQAGLDNDEKRE